MGLYFELVPLLVVRTARGGEGKKSSPRVLTAASLSLHLHPEPEVSQPVALEAGG